MKDKELRKLIGSRAKQRRLELNLTQPYVAEKMGVTASTILRYENGSIDNTKKMVLEGLSEALHRQERLVNYLAKYNKAFLYQKTGYLLERIKEQANISESLLELCRAKGTKSVKWLTNNEESDTFVNKWRMYVPQELTSKEEYELI